VTTQLIVTTSFLKDHPDVVQKLVDGQVAAIDVHDEREGVHVLDDRPLLVVDHALAQQAAAKAAEASNGKKGK